MKLHRPTQAISLGLIGTKPAESRLRICFTNPNNFRNIIDSLERGVLGNAKQAGAQVGAIAAAKYGGPEAVGSEIGGSASEALSNALFNAESTVGFKQHILRSEDQGGGLLINLQGGNRVRLSSRSGASDTVYTCQ